MTRAVSVSPTTQSLVTPHHTRPTPGLLPSWAPLPAPLSRSGCQATTSRTPQVGLPPPSARSSDCTGTSCSSTTAPSSGTARATVRRRRRRCCQRGRTPAASRRLPGQRQRQAPPTATRPPSFGIQAESGVPLGVFQLSGPAVPASPEVRHPYPAPCHGAAHQELDTLQGPASALRRHVFEEQRQLHLPQKHKATVADSTLRVEMNGLEEQADNTKVRELF